MEKKVFILTRVSFAVWWNFTTSLATVAKEILF